LKLHKNITDNTATQTQRFFFGAVMLHVNILQLYIFPFFICLFILDQHRKVWP